MRTTLVILLMAGLVFAATDLNSTFSPAGNGGPDGGGYYWYDQGHSGTTFDWIEISSTGTPMHLLDDDHSTVQALTFDFNFYGTTYYNIWIQTSGTITFVDSEMGYGYVHIPSDTGYYIHTFLAPWWCDLNPQAGGEIYYEAFDDYAVVQFQNIREYHTGNPVTFEVILHEAPDGSTNSDIWFLYNSATSVDGCIGIQGNDTTGTESEYEPMNCVPGDLYLYTPVSNVAIEEATWGQIKAM